MRVAAVGTLLAVAVIAVAVVIALALFDVGLRTGGYPDRVSVEQLVSRTWQDATGSSKLVAVNCSGDRDTWTCVVPPGRSLDVTCDPDGCVWTLPPRDVPALSGGGRFR